MQHFAQYRLKPEFIKWKVNHVLVVLGLGREMRVSCRASQPVYGNSSLSFSCVPHMRGADPVLILYSFLYCSCIPATVVIRSWKQQGLSLPRATTRVAPTEASQTRLV
ncbi:MAG: hypothetical protein EHM33_30120 [Chloroflexi bacterium]|nr:MAG: hypothetical protein EHM33_30120 [Chloroflexota bacterium]